ncbi:MAG: VWA domain-containing protein [Gammaproteobacteria bacterium]|nr:VWA domain-containing protein [Gammaproteobacteria bacterium]
MLLNFFQALKQSGLNISLSEFLTLLEGLSKDVGVLSLDEFYQYSRLCLIKDESLYDHFDQVFSTYWSGRESAFNSAFDEIPDEWLHLKDPSQLTDEQMAMVEALGGWDVLMETLKQRLEEQTDEHHGGSRWIGTGGTSPFGHGGFHPEGIRIGGQARHGKAVKVWEQRKFRNLDGSLEEGTRTFKMALRKLRKMARDGHEEHLDLPETIRSTADNAGLLEIRLRAERRNSIKVLLLLDVGGSMDYHTRICEQLFSAASAEFKRMEHFYFHNFIYEKVWKNNGRRHTDTLSLSELMRTYSKDHRLILVGDATMSPYEIAVPGGSVEHWNEEAGAVWLRRLITAFPHCTWLNPEKPDYWNTTPSIRMTLELMHERMYPLSVDGIQQAIDSLKIPLKQTALDTH